MSVCVLIMGALFIFCDLGEQPFGPDMDEINNPPTTVFDSSTVIDSVTKNMQIMASPSIVRATYSDYAEVTVIITNDNHNPIADQEVFFAATHGVIPLRDTTDENGEAHVTFTSVPINTAAEIRAWTIVDDSTQIVRIPISIVGLEVDIVPDSINTVLNTVIPVTIYVNDASGQPVPNSQLTITGASDLSGVTDGSGRFTTSTTRSSQGKIIVTAKSRGAGDTASYNFWTQIQSGMTNTVTDLRTMRIFSSRTQLRADNSDLAHITVILINENNNPAQGEEITFLANLGIIEESAIVDSTGRATVTLRSAPVNGICVVKAISSGQNDTVSTQVIFSGVSLQLVPQSTNLKVGEDVLIEGYLTDGSGNPIGGEEITFTMTGGTFSNGSPSYITQLDPNGKTIVTATSSTAGTARIHASAQNTSDSTSIVFSNNTLTLSASKTAITAGGIDSARVTATYVDGSNNPLANQLIVFASNSGTITVDSVITNSQGRASTWLKSAAFAGVATVQASATAGDAKIEISFYATIAANISLAVTPDNVSTNGGTSSLIATVTDANGNMVTGADVNFKIIKGPGGNEYIDKPVVTSQNGIARSSLIGGSQPSVYRGCEVIASVGEITDTSKLTISGEPYIITVSRPEDDDVPVQEAGIRDESTFEYYIGAVVQDINGNPVADGTEVHFSAVVSGMRVIIQLFDHWLIDREIKAVLKDWALDIPFEDINNNFRMDNQIDLKLDYIDAIASRGDDVDGNGVVDYNFFDYDFFWDFNGNGVCDPGVGEDIYPVIMGYDLAGNPVYDTLAFADLNGNGVRDSSELAIDHDNDGFCDLPPSGDFRFSLWETRDYFDRSFRFETNDFAVVIDASAVTFDGVAYARITYPRQFARRLYVTVNAEANGKRDRDGERFVLPQIVSEDQ